MPHIDVIKANFLRRTYRSSGNDARFGFRITSITNHPNRDGDFLFTVEVGEVSGEWEFTEPWSVRKEIIAILIEKLSQWGLRPSIEPGDLTVRMAKGA